jgi:hypothetical protein
MFNLTQTPVLNMGYSLWILAQEVRRYFFVSG